MSDTTLVGNLTADPELTFTPGGVGVTKFRIAVNRKRNGEDEAHFFDVECWKDLAENVAESLRKGDRAIVSGDLKLDQWEKDGTKHSRVKVTAWNVGPDLTWARAKVTKTGSTAGGGQHTPPPADDDVPF